MMALIIIIMMTFMPKTTVRIKNVTVASLHSRMCHLLLNNEDDDNDDYNDVYANDYTEEDIYDDNMDECHCCLPLLSHMLSSQ